MTITLTGAEWDQLWDESWEQTGYSPQHEPFVEICQVPSKVGKGMVQGIDLYPDLWLGIGHRAWWDDILTKCPETEHPIQFSFMLSGERTDSNNEQHNPNNTVISGSGIQHEFGLKTPPVLEVGIEIQMSPDRLASFFPDASGQLAAELNFLVKGNDWQTLIYPKSNLAIQRTVQEIVTCPYQGFEKRLFLQGKVPDLIALQLASVLRDRGSLPPPTRLKPSTVANIHYAKDILLSRLEHPPSSLELAQHVGVSDRTLRRGFKELFGKTVFGYLTQQRMIQAERLLRDGKMTVAEVANRVGYAHLGCFAAAFKQQFGITPSECVMGKESIP